MVPDVIVEVVYALPDKQYLRSVKIPDQSTVRQVIEASGILTLRHEIDPATSKLGIFSRPVTLEDKVHEGDRIEIYRPLIADPKELRRLRAERATKK